MKTIPPELADSSAFYGFDIINVSADFPYSERKEITWGIRDRRTGLLACTYSTKESLYKFFEQFQ